MRRRTYQRRLVSALDKDPGELSKSERRAVKLWIARSVRLLGEVPLYIFLQHGVPLAASTMPKHLMIDPLTQTVQKGRVVTVEGVVVRNAEKTEIVKKKGLIPL